MKKLTHRQKQKMARKMMNKAEIKEHENIFDSRAWRLRKQSRNTKRILREKKSQDLSKKRKDKQNYA